MKRNDAAEPQELFMNEVNSLEERVASLEKQMCLQEACDKKMQAHAEQLADFIEKLSVAPQ